MFGVSVLFTTIILLMLVLVTGYLVSIGAKSISWDFFTQIPTGDPDHPGGMRNAIEGTIILVGLASLVGIPLGMLAGIYLCEYSSGSKIASPVRFISDVLAGVPSIVVGILGYELLVVPLGGYNGWAGALALAFIMIPIVARTTEEMLLLVPNSYREASIALGATRARTILRVVVPSATGSIVTGIMLAIARVAGETAPLLFTSLNNRFWSPGINQPTATLPVMIYSYALSPYEDWHRQAWAAGFVLLMLVLTINVSARLILSRSRYSGGR